MEIIILILKIIGITVGILIALCLLLLAAVLAVPVRYRAGAEFYQTKFTGEAMFSWLFRIVNFRICYGEDGLAYKLRLFGISLNLGREKKRRRRGGRKKPSAKPAHSRMAEKPGKSAGEAIGNQKQISGEAMGNQKQIPSEAIRDSKQISGEAMGDQKQIPSEAIRDSKQISGEAGKEKHLPGGNNTVPEGKNKDRQQKDPKRKRKLAGRFRGLWGRLKRRFSDTVANARTAKEKIANIKNMVLDETNQNAFRKFLKEFRYLLRHYSPRKASGELAFGLADPAKTGQVLGALSMFPFWARYKISIMPDFQAQTFFAEGRIMVMGRVRSWHLFLSAIRLVREKDVRQLFDKGQNIS